MILPMPELIEFKDYKHTRMLNKRWIAELGNGDVLTAEKGVITDGISWPPLLDLDSFDDDLLIPGFLHDCLFKIHAYGCRFICNDLMLEAMVQKEISWVERNMIYAGLTVGSEDAWNSYDERLVNMNRKLIKIEKVKV
jgi:hypothetical protein